VLWQNLTAGQNVTHHHDLGDRQLTSFSSLQEIKKNFPKTKVTGQNIRKPGFDTPR
jgi:hypothetical protein